MTLGGEPGGALQAVVRDQRPALGAQVHGSEEEVLSKLVGFLCSTHSDLKEFGVPNRSYAWRYSRVCCRTKVLTSGSRYLYTIIDSRLMPGVDSQPAGLVIRMNKQQP